MYKSKKRISNRWICKGKSYLSDKMTLKLKKINEKDIFQIMKWRMLPDVTKYMYTDPKLSKDSQLKWYKEITQSDSVKYWLENKTFSQEEIAARFHERIETIHPFNNGNGRFGRILIEYFCKREKMKIPTWGEKLKSDMKLRRKTYIDAFVEVRQSGDYQQLISVMFS